MRYRAVFTRKMEAILVSSGDFEQLNSFEWFIHNGYAQAEIEGKPKAMHQFLLPGQIEIDHANGDRLDNRRENLRPCTHQQNSFNMRPHRNKKHGVRAKGVSWWPAKRLYRAKITVSGKTASLGYFKTEEAASDAYEKAARRLHGEFFRKPDTH